MIFEISPADFNSAMEVVSCFCEYQGKILLLQRQDTKSQPNTWGVPAGKIDREELPVTAMVRELGEETSLQITPIELNYFKTIYVRYPEMDFIYHMYSTIFTKQPTIVINPIEHKDFTWVTPRQAVIMPLMLDAGECIQMYYTNNYE